MTLDGTLIDPPSRWTRWSRLWQAVPGGAISALLASLAVVLIGAILVVGLLVVVLPVAILAVGVSLFLRGPIRLRPRIILRR